MDLTGKSDEQLLVRDTGTMSPGFQPGQRIRLLSYNIQTGISTSDYHEYLLGSWKHVLPSRERIQNLDRIARVVERFDVVGLQEVDAGSLRTGFVSQTKYLAERASMPFWYEQTNRRLGNVARHSTGVLAQCRPTEVCEYKLPGLIPGRGALLLRYGRDENALVVVVIHLALSQRARDRQLAFVADIIARYRHVVVMGDLNCRSASREMRNFLACTELCEPLQDLHTFPSWRPERGIDHILVTPTLTVEKARVLEHAYSDHLPIAMEIRLPGEAEAKAA